MVYLTSYPNFYVSSTSQEKLHTPRFQSIKAELWYRIRITERRPTVNEANLLGGLSTNERLPSIRVCLVLAAALCTPNWLRTRSFNKRAHFMLSFNRKLWGTHWNIRCTELVSHFIILVILLGIRCLAALRFI